MKKNNGFEYVTRYFRDPDTNQSYITEHLLDYANINYIERYVYGTIEIPEGVDVTGIMMFHGEFLVVEGNFKEYCEKYMNFRNNQDNLKIRYTKN